MHFWFRAAACMALFGGCVITAGSLSAQEVDRSAVRERVLQRFDTDGDGRLSADERSALLEFARGRRQAGAAAKTGLRQLYKIDAGPHEVTTRETLILHDANRDKDLQIRVTFPASDGPCPVIVWSHGATGTKDNYQPLVEHWVSHGYVCIQPNHSESRALAGSPDGDQLGPKTFADWANRPKDIVFILDSLAKIGKQVEGLAGKIDQKRIGVGGHSFGAHTAQLVAGTTTKDFSGHRTSHADPRPTAFLLISPQGRGMLLDESSWKGMTRPALVVTGSNDLGRGGQRVQWRLDPFRLSPAPDKYLLFVDGAHHGFGGITGAMAYRNAGAANPNHLAYVQSATTAFWDKFLKKEKAATSFLHSKRIAELSEGEAGLEKRKSP